MFESLSDKLQNIARKLKGTARITEKDLKEMLREVKLRRFIPIRFSQGITLTKVH